MLLKWFGIHLCRLTGKTLH